jgi:hypothetical protein
VADSTSNARDRAASIQREGLDVWVTQAKRLHDRSREKSMWSPEDIVGDVTDLMEHLTPLVERTIELGLDLVRPWAAQFEARSSAAREGTVEPAAPSEATEAAVVRPKAKGKAGA